MFSIDCSNYPYEDFDNILKPFIEGALDNIIENGGEIRLTHIISSDFLEMFGLDTPDDFNGWCCDWFTTMNYKGTKINIDGCAWYGTISLYLEE